VSVMFTDGPADGHELALQRAPMFLRVVVDTREPLKRNGLPRVKAIDALDLLDDEPRPHESIHIYEVIWANEPVHICARGSGARSGWYVSASYRHRADVDGEQMRDTAAWRAWTTSAGHERLGVRDLAAARERKGGTAT
jgi:hypothetical protein